MRYYVYEYWIDGVPEYVGKGTNNLKQQPRCTYHLKDPRATHWTRHLRSSIKKDKNIQIKIAFIFEYERDALNHEIALIEKYGRRDLGTGTLYNKTNGGDGVVGISKRPPMSAVTKAKLSLARKGVPRPDCVRQAISEGLQSSKKYKCHQIKKRIETLEARLDAARKDLARLNA